MTKYLIVLTIAFFWGVSYCQSQSRDKNKLKTDFEMDSTGCLGLRLNYVHLQGKSKLLIDEMDFKTLEIDSVIKMIGKPNQHFARSEYIRNGKQGTTITIENLWYDLTCEKKKKSLLITVYMNRVSNLEIRNK